jgi:hypothetical protein
MPFPHREVGFLGLGGNRMTLRHKSKAAGVTDTESPVTLRREVFTLDVRAAGAYAKVKRSIAVLMPGTVK